MAQPDQTPNVPADPAAKCRSVKDLLVDVTSELNKFEAKKLADLKTELDAFVKKQDALNADYKKQYPLLRERWCTQHQSVQSLHASLINALPPDEWNKVVHDCVCSKQSELATRSAEISKRQRLGLGEREGARDAAKSGFEAAKDRLDTLAANAQKIAQLLNDDDKLLKDIPSYIGSDPGLAVYLFWFRLLPVHKLLMPDDVGPECEAFGKGESPQELCSAAPRTSDPGKTPAPPTPTPSAPAPTPKRPAPWLIGTDAYLGELDCAWQDYHDAKTGYAEQDAAFKAAPDDLVSLIKARDELAKSLDARIKDCLQQLELADACCGTRA